MTRGADLFTYCSVILANPKGAVVFNVFTGLSNLPSFRTVETHTPGN